MARSESSAGSSRVFVLILVIAVVAVLYLAKEILVPFALALLLSFLLAPLVQRLEKLKIGRVASVVVVVVLAFGALGVVATIVANQLVDLAGNVRSYQENIESKLEAVRSWGPLRTLRTVSEKMTHPKTAADALPSTADESPQPPPVPVTVVESGSPWSTFLQSFVTPTLGALANAGVVIIFVIFILIEREDLRNRLVRLIGPGRISATTQAFDEATQRVSRYLIMQFIVNASFGVTLAVGLYLIGLPNAILWGFLGGLLRYIPYIGPFLAAIIPIGLSLAAFDSWRYPLLTIGLFALLELLSNNVMEPLLYSSTTGISTIGILLAAVFWTWLWGGVGLVLATPLTVCIAVMARYVPQLEFFNVLLSDEPVLEPGAHLYQRLLADDLEEATELVEKHAAQHSLAEVYDQVLLPTLVLAEQDAHRGGIADGKLEYVRESVREMVDELAERAVLAAAEASEGGAAETATPSRQPLVMCLPARDESDEIAALMLHHLLLAQGYGAQVVSVQALASEMLEQVADQNLRLVFVSAVPPFAVSHTRYLCKRLRARFPELKIVVGLWHSGDGKTRENPRSVAADKVVTTLPQALEGV